VPPLSVTLCFSITDAADQTLHERAPRGPQGERGRKVSGSCPIRSPRFSTPRPMKCGRLHSVCFWFGYTRKRFVMHKETLP
jgi:hypothetical protein